jgi:methylase of polypeptide subunit release factors
MAIKLITEPVDVWHHYTAILNNIKDILKRDWQVLILHNFREGNICADYLANNNVIYLFIPPLPSRLLN